MRGDDVADLFGEGRGVPTGEGLDRQRLQTVRRIGWRPPRTNPRFGSALWVPSMTMGRTGTSLRRAKSNAPGLNA